MLIEGRSPYIRTPNDVGDPYLIVVMFLYQIGERTKKCDPRFFATLGAIRHAKAAFAGSTLLEDEPSGKGPRKYAICGNS